MKIGFFCTFFPEKTPFTKTEGFSYGGADESIYDTVKQLHKLGHEITIFSIGTGKKTQYESPSTGLELYRFPVLRVPFFTIPYSLNGFLSLKFLRIKKNYHFDVIHAKVGNPPGGEAALDYKKRYHCPMVLDIGGPQNPRWGSFFRRNAMRVYLKLIYPIVLNGTDAILIHSEEYLTDDIILQPFKEKIHVIPHGLNFDFFSQYDDTKLENIPYINQIGKNKKIILFVGNLVESKGVHILIKAFQKSCIEHSDLVLIIAGKGSMQNQLELLVNELGLNDRVFFVGYLDKNSLNKLYHYSHLFVFPSMSEGFPRVLLESMAAGTPCLVSDIGANRGALGNGRVGFTAKCFDVNDFADKMSFFFAHDEVWYENESIKSKKYARKFSWEKTTKELEKIYQKLSDKK